MMLAFRKGFDGAAITEWARRYDASTDLRMEQVIAPGRSEAWLFRQAGVHRNVCMENAAIQVTMFEKRRLGC
jgi:hypothetical protein